MNILDGKVVSEELLSNLKIKINAYMSDNKNLSPPKIAIIMVGDNQASLAYVNSKIKYATKSDIISQLIFLANTTSEKDLLAKISELNSSNDIDGIMIQLPLPSHISKEKIINAIDPKKDIDGFHPLNFGRMAIGQKSLRPATAYGILKLIEYYKIETNGKHIVVIGRSNIVGKPISIMLGNDFNIGRATVTTCDINTPFELLKEESLRADIVIVAVGKQNFLTQDMIKDGATVIDVGINRNSENQIVGDCDFENIKDKCSWITPVPGGVGPMTICGLLLNSFDVWKEKNNLYYDPRIVSDKTNDTKVIQIAQAKKEITVNHVENFDFILNNLRMGKKFIGTYDHNRKPKDETEIIQVIGDYPVGEHSLISKNPSYRHYKWALKHEFDEFESDPCWDSIDVIYVINDPARQDRLYDTLKEFKKMGVPLNKVIIKEAQFHNSTSNSYANRLIGCFKSHLAVFEKLLESNYENMLIFEDDFTFSDPMEENKKQLEEFFKRKYDYDVLLLSTSASGKIIPKDDLLCYSYQECTTASGYLLSRKGLEKVLPIWKEGISGLSTDCDFNNWACDRYWNKIQVDNKMLTFHRKIGYQRPAYSTTLNQMTYYLD